MSCHLKPAIWSRDTGQRIPCIDRCQLIITWMSNTKEVHSKPRLHVSLSTCYLEYGSHLARLHRRRRRRRRAYAPTSNTASHDNHEKIKSWVSFCFPYMGCLWGSAWRPLGPPELRYIFVRFFAVLNKTTVWGWTKFCLSSTTGRRRPHIFRICIWNWTLALHIQLEQVLRQTAGFQYHTIQIRSN